MTAIKIDNRTPAERLRLIPFEEVVERTAACCFEAACQLPADVLQAIHDAAQKETSQLGKGFLQQYIENAKIASEHPMPICQDTGFAVFFVITLNILCRSKSCIKLKCHKFFCLFRNFLSKHTDTGTDFKHSVFISHSGLSDNFGTDFGVNNEILTKSL